MLTAWSSTFENHSVRRTSRSRVADGTSTSVTITPIRLCDLVRPEPLHGFKRFDEVTAAATRVPVGTSSARRHATPSPSRSCPAGVFVIARSPGTFQIGTPLNSDDDVALRRPDFAAGPSLDHVRHRHAAR